MMRSTRWRGMAVSLVACTAIIACGKPDARANAADPNTPAVVRVPPPVLPSDTARKPVETKTVVSWEEARTTVSRDYAMLGAALAFSDPKLLLSSYSPTAVLTTPNGTFTGSDAILKEYRGFGMDGSVKAFNRQSQVLKVVDSTVVDSGVYTFVRKRDRGDSTVTRGTYATVWQIVPPPKDWVMTKDRLYPAVKKKGK
jgi:hypothetical protein